MTEKELKEGLKRICQGAATPYFEALYLKLKTTQDIPKFDGSTEKLVYETGKNAGYVSGIETFYEYLTTYHE